ncbi:MAG: M20/M25/M40 family metallo-hydrolase [Anaerolineaceae bacterium]|nr:M20/M25/M40 family metallo-hydrolase [Anaerolineaceae bacterium]
MKELKPFLKELLSLPGLSGYEKPVHDVIAKTWEPLVDELSTSTVGSLQALKIGAREGDAPNIMIATHMDAIGLIITQIVEGFLKITQVGGIDPRILPGQPVTVYGKEEIPGIIVQPPDFLLPENLAKKPVPLEHLLIDTGLLPEEVNQLVRVGDIVSFATTPMDLDGDVIAGHTLDNRASVAALTYCLSELQHIKHHWNVWAVATVQEEVTLAGALTSPFNIQPDLAIAVDVTFAKGPGATSDLETVPFGKGITIGHGPNMHPALRKALKQLADDIDMPSSMEFSTAHSGTDAYALQIVAEGIPTALLGIPLRYMHTPVEAVAMKDIKRAGRLLAEFIARLTPEFAETINWEETK